MSIFGIIFKNAARFLQVRIIGVTLPHSTDKTMYMKMNRIKTLTLAFVASMATSGVCARQTAAPALQVDTIIAVDLDAKYGASMLKSGVQAPEINLKTIDGKRFSLASLRGKYVVLDFWASWCPDCRKDAPNIVALYDKYHSRGVEFVGVSFDRSVDAWKKGVEKLNIPYTQVSDLKNMRESAVAQAYGIKWIPSVYVIDPDGKVVLSTVISEKVGAYLTSIIPDCAE